MPACRPGATPAPDFKSSSISRAATGSQEGRCGARAWRPCASRLRHKKSGASRLRHKKTGASRLRHKKPGASRLRHKKPGASRLRHKKTGASRLRHKKNRDGRSRPCSGLRGGAMSHGEIHRREAVGSALRRNRISSARPCARSVRSGPWGRPRSGIQPARLRQACGSPGS